MTFKDALEEMKKGNKVKLPEWVGYWFIRDNDILIHCSDGKVISITETEVPIITAEFMARDDWEVVNEGYFKPSYMDFSEALRHLKCGNKLTRKGWNGKGMFVAYQKGYPDGIPCNKQTAETWGLQEGDLFKCNPYFQLKNVDGSYSMWTPSSGDLNATDWRLYDENNND